MSARGPPASGAGRAVRAPGRPVLTAPRDSLSSGRTTWTARRLRPRFGRETAGRGRFARPHDAYAEWEEREPGPLVRAVRRVHGRRGTPWTPAAVREDHSGLPGSNGGTAIASPGKAALGHTFRRIRALKALLEPREHGMAADAQQAPIALTSDAKSMNRLHRVRRAQPKRPLAR